MPWIRRALSVLTGFALVAALVYGFLPEPVPAEFATVSHGPLRVTIDAEAVTRVRESFVVRAPLAAHMERLPLKPGAHLAPGDLLTRLRGLGPLLDARGVEQAEAGVLAAEAGVRQAEAAVAGAAAEHEFAGAESARARRLLAAKMIAPEAADAAATRHKAARATLDAATFAAEAARFQLQVARAALGTDGAHETLELRSPVAGQVLRVARESEGTVAPGEPLIEIGDLGGLEIVADLLSQDAVRVRSGMSVQIERWGGPTLTGRVRTIEPGGFTHISALGVEEQRVNVLIDITEEPQRFESLGDGFRVEVRVILLEIADALRVPLAAVFRVADGDAVFVADNRTAVLRRVELGARTGMEAEVRDGLREGERVVIHPSDLIRDGMALRER